MIFGTHNSMTYGIKTPAIAAADADPFLAKYFKLIPEKFILKWARTQKNSVIEQLKNGVRYFDLRIVINHNEPPARNFFFSHAVYSQEITEPLEKVNEFLTNHPKECVILDCHRIVGLKAEQHVVLMEKLLEIFGQKVFVKENNSLSACTLNGLHVNSQQVLIIYRDSRVTDNFWATYDWPSAWLETSQTYKIKNFMAAELQERRSYTGFVTQLILAPTPWLRVFSNLRNACAKKVINELSEWVEQQTPGPFEDGEPPTSNVFTADFVEIEDWKFCKMVINLNSKIVKKTQP